MLTIISIIASIIEIIFGLFIIIECTKVLKGIKKAEKESRARAEEKARIKAELKKEWETKTGVYSYLKK